MKGERRTYQLYCEPNDTIHCKGKVKQIMTVGTDRRKDLLKEVEKCVCAERQNTYGDAEDNFEVIAKLVTIMLQGKLVEKITALDIAKINACIKMARIITSPEHLDNWIDLAGYAVCGGGIVMKNQDGENEI